jgi:type IV secretory pathway VirB3-like protein
VLVWVRESTSMMSCGGGGSRKSVLVVLLIVVLLIGLHVGWALHLVSHLVSLRDAAFAQSLLL